MLASVRQCSSAMSFPSSEPSPPKRPRLSLQIRTPSAAQLGKSATALKADVDPTSPTAFNTLSNAYAAAIENASPLTPRPASNTDIKVTTKPTSLRLETSITPRHEYAHPSQRTQTPGPFSIAYPNTPSSAHPGSTPTTAHPNSITNITTPSFTFTPPQSAGTADQSVSKIFSFSANTPTKGSPSTPRTLRRRATIGGHYHHPPYTHPRSLHSILRNSPLPPRSTVTPVTPSRRSMRIANQGPKRVDYTDPLTQTITTNKYIKSHIDLLEESPYSATDPEIPKAETLELAMKYTGDETRDGGQTPGPFEEMRRRMAESGLETPATRKRKRREKKRKWRWTLGEDGEEVEEGSEGERTATPRTAFKKTPVTAIRRAVSVSTDEDSSMSEAEERPGTAQSL